MRVTKKCRQIEVYVDKDKQEMFPIHVHKKLCTVATIIILASGFLKFLT